MPLYFGRPTSQHAAANVLSATSEAGLTIQEPEPGTANAGVLRLRCSGVPTAAVDATVTLSTGGAASGYTISSTTGAGGGATAKWLRTGDAATLQRGYADTPVLSQVMIPLTYSANHGTPSTPRELPDGYLGLIVPNSSTLAVTFYRINSAGTVSSVAIGGTMASATTRPDFVILASGRLVAIIPVNDSVGGLYTYYSDDYGVSWSLLNSAARGNAFLYVCCAEVVSDDIVLVRADVTSGTSYIFLSRDGGGSFASVGSVTLDDPRTCVRDGVVYVVGRQAVSLGVWMIAPGGTASATAIATGVGTNDAGCIVCRDDGVLWAFGWQATTGGTLDMDCGASTDGGLTWTDPGASPLTLIKTGYAANGYMDFAGGMWNGRMVLVARVDSAADSDNGIHLLMFGEWTNVGYNAAYKGFTPVALPENLTWTRTNGGAGATVTNQGTLRLISTGANYTDYLAPAGVWGGVVTAATLRFTLRVNSGGSLANNSCRVTALMSDGADQQGIIVRFTNAAARCYDTSGAQLGSDLSVSLDANYVDFLVGMAFDYPSAGSGKVSIWYRLHGGETWTAWLSNVTITELAATVVSVCRFGGAVGASANWEIVHIGMDDSADTGLAAATHALAGRPLSAAFDYDLVSGVNLGAYGTGGIASDTYAVSTRYTYGAENVWTELRPSRRAESTSDTGAWGIVFDAGANSLLRGDLIAVFGTNMRTASWQLNAADSWGAPSVTTSLDATITSFTVGAGVRGQGYVGPTATPNWRPGAYKSNGDSRRFFLQYNDGTNDVVSEITDNDEDRIYVDDVSFTGATGTAYIFGDRMAATLTFAQYRYARFTVAAGQTTADGAHRLGTPIFCKKWTPAQLYDFGFVDKTEPNVTTTDTDNGSSVSYRRGPALDSLAIQWPPVDRLRYDVVERLRDFYRSIDGALTPVVLWRSSTDITTLAMVEVREVYMATNVLGELTNAVTRVDQLVLREVW